jgi:hypothetical protein
MSNVIYCNCFVVFVYNIDDTIIHYLNDNNLLNLEDMAHYFFIFLVNLPS